MRGFFSGSPSPDTSLPLHLEGPRSTSRVSLLLASGLLVFSPLWDGGTTHLAVMIIRLIILLFFAVSLWTGIKNGVLRCPVFPPALPILAYLGLGAVATVFSPYIHQSLQWLIVLLSYAVLLYLLVSFISEWDHIRILLAVLVGMGVGEAGLAMVQAGWLSAPRPSGSFFNPNFLSEYLAAVWSVLLGYLCCTWRGIPRAQRCRRLLVPALAGAALALLLTAIVWTGSRGGLLALATGTAVVVGVRFGRKALAVLLLLFLVGLLFPTPLRDRFLAEHVANPLGYARLQIWQSSVHAMAEHPLGVGLGLYQYVYPRYALPIEGQITRYGKVAQTAHSEYLQMGVELGVAGIGIFSWGVFLVAREAVSVLRQRLRRWQRGVAVGVSGSAAGILAHAAADSNLHEPALAIVLTLCVGILIAVRRLSGHSRDAVCIVPVRSRLLWGSCGVLVIGLLAVGVSRLGMAWMAFEAGSEASARQDYNRAIGNYQVALVLDPGKALYHSAMAAAHFQIFQRTREGAAAQAALTELQSAIVLNPLDGRLPGLLGHLYVTFSQAITPSVDSPETARERQRAWLRSARAAYERATELEPFAASSQFELARVYLALGERELAQARVRRAIDIEPNYLPGREWLARLYLQSQQFAAANREYHEILDRQRRYAKWIKDSTEESFLKADAASLAAALEEARART